MVIIRASPGNEYHSQYRAAEFEDWPLLELQVPWVEQGLARLYTRMLIIKAVKFSICRKLWCLVHLPFNLVNILWKAIYWSPSWRSFRGLVNHHLWKLSVGREPVAIVAPSKWIFEFLKSASCSTLGLMWLTVSLKYLFVHIIHAQVLRLECQQTNWKPCGRCRIMLCSSVLLSPQWERQLLGHSMLTHIAKTRRKESPYAVTESKRNSVFKRRKDSSGQEK